MKSRESGWSCMIWNGQKGLKWAVCQTERSSIPEEDGLWWLLGIKVNGRKGRKWTVPRKNERSKEMSGYFWQRSERIFCKNAFYITFWLDFNRWSALISSCKSLCNFKITESLRCKRMYDESINAYIFAKIRVIHVLTVLDSISRVTNLQKLSILKNDKLKYFCNICTNDDLRSSPSDTLSLNMGKHPIHSPLIAI